MSHRDVRQVRLLTWNAKVGDPLKLVANPPLANSEWMLESIVQDFAGLGYDADELTNLFRSPAYPVLNQLLDYLGPGEIRRRIDFLLTTSRVAGTRGVLTETQLG